MGADKSPNMTRGGVFAGAFCMVMLSLRGFCGAPDHHQRNHTNGRLHQKAIDVGVAPARMKNVADAVRCGTGCT